MDKFTREQGIVITGYTGITACKFSDFHADVERRIGHAVYSSQFGEKNFFKKVQELYKDDFIKMVSE